MGSSSYVLLLIHFFVLTSIFLDARIVADSEGSDVVNTDEVDSNDAKCSTPDVMCIDLYAPVKCENDCTYSNLCFALAAQQLKCCPIPDEDITCPMIYDPITCADGCAYENDCYAEAAGFKLTTCVREPIKETTENNNSYGGDQKLVFLITFTDEHEMAAIVEQIQTTYSEYLLDIRLLSAVGIGIVEFDITKISNMDAKSLLQNIEGIKTVEEDSIVSINNINDEVKETGDVHTKCSTPADVMCEMIYAPVKCENDCTYSNLCFAFTAQQSKCCPVPDKDITCPMIYDPTTCANGCVYENDCSASAAGFQLKTCVRGVGSGSIGGFVVSLWTSGFVFAVAVKMTIM